MTFLSLLIALVLEQVWPLRRENPVHDGFGRYVQYLERQFNGGERRHGVIAWALAALAPVTVVAVAHHALHAASPLAGWLWSIAVLYFTMGFRRFSHAFNGVHEALRAGDVATARELLGRWRGESASELTASEVARVAIEQGLLASHRHVFGTLFWFAVLGPAGAVLYFAAGVVAEAWAARLDPQPAGFGWWAERAFFWLDWAPARLVAASFAVVGDFEDAVYCWRTQAGGWAGRAQGIVLAAGGGALGVRLGEALHQDGTLRYRPELGLGDDADADAMQHAVGLIWRALVLWMFLILVVSVAHALG